MKILVTGGTGYIGSHTVVELQNAGYEVVVIDNFDNSHPSVLLNIEKITGKKVIFEKIDIRDKKSLKDFVSNNKDIDAIIHFAASKAVGESVEKPLKYYENNVGGTLNLLEAMQENGIENIVFSSSCTVYGEATPPVNEDAPIMIAQSPYGNTKQICEEVLLDQTNASNLKTVSLRYFNPVGAHDSALIGELPLGVPNNLVPYITQTAIGKREILTVFGNDYNTPDGTCIRDFIHVVDLAKAHIKAVEYLTNKKYKSSFSVFNLGTGKGSSVLEVIQTFEKVTQVKLNYKIGSRRGGDITQIYAGCEKAESELGWKTERDLENCMKTAWDWEKNLENINVSE
ncbi:MAG: UDP-glucose 4-epimerase GalE [Bacteroidetes bacterium]|jgi:UDP-glucose 4-epimerase|nr:UDP-glucose 4-epimerase GalE [Bacteroidota bacterium]